MADKLPLIVLDSCHAHISNSGLSLAFLEQPSEDYRSTFFLRVTLQAFAVPLEVMVPMPAHVTSWLAETLTKHAPRVSQEEKRSSWNPFRDSLTTYENGVKTSKDPQVGSTDGGSSKDSVEDALRQIRVASGKYT